MKPVLIGCGILLLLLAFALVLIYCPPPKQEKRYPYDCDFYRDLAAKDVPARCFDGFRGTREERKP